MNSLKVVQKKILRIMSFKGKFEHNAPLFTAFNILPIDQVNSYMCLIYLYRCLKNETDNTFLLNIPIHYQTRLANAGSLIVPNYRSIHSRQSVRWRGIQLWNSTPSNILEIQQCDTFKINLKKYLLGLIAWITCNCKFQK